MELFPLKHLPTVLILVLVEVVLWEWLLSGRVVLLAVLILVLVEVVLWVWSRTSFSNCSYLVLILVLVEVVLWGMLHRKNRPRACCLNPCFSGSCSLSRHCIVTSDRGHYGLNPCFSGSCSLRGWWKPSHLKWASLNPCFSGSCSLRVREASRLNGCSSLNPCFSGSCSLSSIEHRRRRYSHPGLNPCFSGSCSLSVEEI